MYYITLQGKAIAIGRKYTFQTVGHEVLVWQVKAAEWNEERKIQLKEVVCKFREIKVNLAEC